MDTLSQRSKVDYVNNVRPGAMRTLSITKALYDQTGQNPLHYADDKTLFTFRLYLGDENADPADLPLANLYSYYIKDPNGYYCRWNASQQRFESLGMKDYGELLAYFEANSWTEAQKETVIFKTSMNGSISKIPVDYTVEVRDLIITTKYKVEERAGEIPRGYTLRSGDGYTRVDLEPEDTTGDIPYSDTIRKDEDPQIQVRNQLGWGLTAQKIWTDKDFMRDRDPIYFAIYLKTRTNPVKYELYPDSVR